MARRFCAHVLFSETRGATVRMQALARRRAATARLKTARAAQTTLANLRRKIIATRRFGVFRLSVLTVQTHARMALARWDYRAARVAAIQISSCWLYYHVLTKTLIGNMLSRARLTCGKLEQTKKHLLSEMAREKDAHKSTKAQLDTAKLDLASLRERVERETENAVVAAVVSSLDQGGALATPVPSGHECGRGASSSVRERFLRLIGASGSLPTAVATMLTQFKSHATCPNCEHESITFDQYLSLSLPLPILVRAVDVTY